MKYPNAPVSLQTSVNGLSVHSTGKMLIFRAYLFIVIFCAFTCTIVRSNATDNQSLTSQHSQTTNAIPIVIESRNDASDKTLSDSIDAESAESSASSSAEHDSDGDDDDDDEEEVVLTTEILLSCKSVLCTNHTETGNQTQLNLNTIKMPKNVNVSSKTSPNGQITVLNGPMSAISTGLITGQTSENEIVPESTTTTATTTDAQVKDEENNVITKHDLTTSESSHSEQYQTSTQNNIVETSLGANRSSDNLTDGTTIDVNSLLVETTTLTNVEEFTTQQNKHTEPATTPTIATTPTTPTNNNSASTQNHSQITTTENSVEGVKTLETPPNPIVISTTPTPTHSNDSIRDNNIVLKVSPDGKAEQSDKTEVLVAKPNSSDVIRNHEKDILPVKLNSTNTVPAQNSTTLINNKQNIIATDKLSRPGGGKIATVGRFQSKTKPVTLVGNNKKELWSKGRAQKKLRFGTRLSPTQTPIPLHVHAHQPQTQQQQSHHTTRTTEIGPGPVHELNLQFIQHPNMPKDNEQMLALFQTRPGFVGAQNLSPLLKNRKHKQKRPLLRYKYNHEMMNFIAPIKPNKLGVGESEQQSIFERKPVFAQTITPNGIIHHPMAIGIATKPDGKTTEVPYTLVRHYVRTYAYDGSLLPGAHPLEVEKHINLAALPSRETLPTVANSPYLEQTRPQQQHPTNQQMIQLGYAGVAPSTIHNIPGIVAQANRPVNRQLEFLSDNPGAIRSSTTPIMLLTSPISVLKLPNADILSNSADEQHRAVAQQQQQQHQQQQQQQQQQHHHHLHHHHQQPQQQQQPPKDPFEEFYSERVLPANSMLHYSLVNFGPYGRRIVATLREPLSSQPTRMSVTAMSHLTNVSKQFPTFRAQSGTLSAKLNRKSRHNRTNLKSHVRQ